MDMIYSCYPWHSNQTASFAFAAPQDFEKKVEIEAAKLRARTKARLEWIGDGCLKAT